MDEFFIDYSDLDDFQRQLIDRKNNRSMVVMGSAGSGKSLIALHKAKQLASTESYVVVVYTKTLRKYFSDGMKELGLSNVFHYHQWRHKQEHVKYMIVDECQDFSSSQIDELRKCGDICFFFGDTKQSIMGFKEGGVQSVERTAAILGVTPEKLYFNYRLTKAIAPLAEIVGKEEDLVIKCKRDGEKPHLLEADNFNAQLDKIAETIKNRSLTSVGILMRYNTADNGMLSVEYVKDYLKNKGVTCEFKYNDQEATSMDLNFNSNNPKIMTWWCAKGLQFKDVFIPGCEHTYNDSDRSAMYVAMTRCSERLYLGYSDHLCSFFPSPSSSVYDNSGSLKMV